MDGQQRMIEAQAQVITRLNEEIANIKKGDETTKRRLARMEAPAYFYTKLVEAVSTNVTLQSEWSRFLMILSMACPELEDDMRNTTPYDRYKYLEEKFKE